MCSRRVTPVWRQASTIFSGNSVCTRAKPRPSRPFSLRMPTRLITVSRSSNCLRRNSGSYTSPCTSRTVGNTSRSRWRSRWRVKMTMSCPASDRRAARRFPTKPVPPSRHILCVDIGMAFESGNISQSSTSPGARGQAPSMPRGDCEKPLEGIREPDQGEGCLTRAERHNVILVPRAIDGIPDVAAFGRIHRHVGALAQGGDILAVLRIHGDTDAAGALERVVSDLEGRLQNLDQLLGDLHRPGLVGGGKHKGELVAAEPAGRVRLPQDTPLTQGYLFQQAVAPVVPMAVVDLLELIEVDHDKRQRFFLAPGDQNSLLQPVLDQRTVRQVCQRVVQRQ